MSLVALDGTPLVAIGAGQRFQSTPGAGTVAIDAANEAIICIGRIITSDLGSHTIDTTGSSSLQWRTAGATFANAGTTVKVGLAAVDAANGPPARAANAAGVITFDVSKSMTGGGGGVTANAWQTHVPDAGSKTIASGDLVAFAVQMTARGGVDTVSIPSLDIGTPMHRPTVTAFTGGSYANQSFLPNAVIVFSDGAIGYFYASEVYSAVTSRVWSSGSATKEYGQLFRLPFPTKVYGIYGIVNPSADLDLVLYSDPLGTPVAEKTVSVDSNVVALAAARQVFELFPAPYTTVADQFIGAVFKPGASNITAYYRTLGNAAHRVADPWGTRGYGISRASGAFADANSSLDHYYIGLLCGAFDAGGGSSGLASPMHGMAVS